MDIILMAVGSVKSAELRASIQEYARRISTYVHFSIVEVKEVTSYSSKENLAREAAEIRARLPREASLVCFAIEGKSYSSVAFSQALERRLAHDARPLVFLIGSSDGIDESLKASASALVSASLFTFPHQLMRLIALEQIYRAFTIIHHEPYHK